MSFLAEVSEALQFDSNVAVTSCSSGGGVATATYEYHLPHTKTLDLIGEEFAPRKTHHLSEAGPNVVVVSAMPTGVSGSLLPANLTPMVITSSAHGDTLHHTHISTTSAHGHGHGATAIPLSTVIDLPSLAAGAADDSGGVLLCNLDELLRYIPENFCSENMLDSNNLEATTFAPSLSTATATKLSSTSISLSNGTIFQASPISSGNYVTVSSAATPITITLPTQPQPLHSVKSVTYVQGNQPIMSSGFKVHHQHNQQMSPQLQPMKFTTTGYAIGPSGERIAIQGLTPHDPHRQHQTLQLVKTSTAGGSLQQAIQFNFDPSKFTVLHELPDVGKFVIQEQRSNHDSISTILEEMRSGEEASSAGVEYTTAIPVALASLTPTDPKKAGLARLGAPSTIVLPAPGKKGSPRNFIFAGNTLPQGAIPIQLNGLNAMPLSAVKSIPLPVNLSTLAPHGHGQAATVLTTATLPTQPNPPQSPIAAKKTKVEVVASVPASAANAAANTRASAAMAAATVTSIVNRISNNNNNNTHKPSGSGSGPLRPSNNGAPINRVGVAAISAANGNKTCTWQFENGEICGKTFSKSYNLVVHMRMHEDVRPFQCGLCDQTFRQKAHLQRHETTHGIGTKVSRSSAGASSSSAAAASSASAGFSSSKRRRRNRSSGGGRSTAADQPTPVISASLQERLARVNQQFGKKSEAKAEDSHDEDEQHEDLYDSVGSAGDAKDEHEHHPVLKSYSPKRKLNGSGGLQEVVISSDVTAVGQIIEFKEVASSDDGDMDSDGALAKAAKLRRLSVRLERLGDDSEDTKGDEVSAAVRAIQTDDGENSVPTTMSGLSSAYAEVSEDLMHEHHATDLSQSFAAAVNEAVGGSDIIEVVGTEASQGHIVTLTQAMADGNNTIVLKGFDGIEHNPDIQKEILKAILVGTGSGAGHAGSISVVTTTSSGTFLGDHLIVKGRDDSSNVKVEHVEANTYSPMTSQEFHEQH